MYQIKYYTYTILCKKLLYLYSMCLKVLYLYNNVYEITISTYITMCIKKAVYNIACKSTMFL